MERLAVFGAGTMGHSIALSAAWYNFEVTMYGVNDEDIKRGITGIEQKLMTLVKKAVISDQEKTEIIGKIKTETAVKEAVEGATFVIEAVPEDLEIKKELFEKLDQMCGENVILASNTSGLSPTAIASKTKSPSRTVVTHFWNPGHLIPLVEVVRGEKTSDETVERAIELLNSMNKKPIEVKKDVLGSVGNRLQYALFREAQYLYEQGIASIEDIDAAVKYSIGRRLPITGPFMTADMGGLDVFDAISNYVFEDLSTAKHSLKTMEQLVSGNKLGQKNGEGFYKWTSEFSREMDEQREELLIEMLKKDLQDKVISS
jgi:3-hydroxybutyryl-CoA dehydrogenase